MEDVPYGNARYLSAVPYERATDAACRVLAEGGVVLYPTDTVYGLGADATSERAVETVRRIKGRERSKPILALVSDMAMLAAYARLTPRAFVLAQAFLPGPLTLVLDPLGAALKPLWAPDGSVGFRMPDHPLCQALPYAFGRPITTTSANRAGMTQPATLRGMCAQLGPTTSPMLVLDDGVRTGSPSTIVDVRGDVAHIVREGALSRARIEAVLART